MSNNNKASKRSYDAIFTALFEIHLSVSDLSPAEISIVICDKEDKAESLLKNKEKGITPTLSCLVLFNPFSAALLERGRTCGVEILQLSQIMVRNIVTK